MNGVVYKWRIKDCIYGYLTDRVGGDPFISSTKENDEQISKAVNSFDEEQYKSHYEALCTLLRQKGYNVQMLDYKYYYGVDDTSCGLLKYAGEAYKGETGKDGISVVDVMALGDFNGFSVLRFTFSNGTHKDVPIRTPKDGVSPENGVDGADGNTLALIMELDHEKAEFQAEIDAALDKIRQEMRELWDNSRDALTSFQLDLSALTHNSGYIQTVMDELAGLERKIYGYINISALTKTEFTNVFAPYSGYVETLGTYVNSALQTVVLFENRIDMAEAQLHTAMSYYDNIAGVLNEYDEKYDAVNIRYDQIVAQLTDNGTISFTDIFQTARSVGMILASDSSITGSDSLYYDYGDTLVAGIIAKINDNNSGTEMQIRADKIYLLGETVASGLSALDIWVGGGNTYFASDGSGYIANHYIEWDKWGNVTIQGQLSVDEIIDTLGNSMIQFGTNGGSKAQTMFSPDGSGWLSGGAIYWDENGHLTISKDVTIEGQLSISQMVDGIRKETVCFGDTESTAVTIFRPDGSGQLAGGAISWDVDGRLVIANDLYVTGSIYQGFLNYANGADVNFGNFTSNFYADGDFNLANGALIYDSDTSTLTIKGNVVIEGQDDGMGNYIESYLKTENLYIGKKVDGVTIDDFTEDKCGYSAFFENNPGKGYLAHGAIVWKETGELTVNGNLISRSNESKTECKLDVGSGKGILFYAPSELQHGTELPASGSTKTPIGGLYWSSAYDGDATYPELTLYLRDGLGGSYCLLSPSTGISLKTNLDETIGITSRRIWYENSNHNSFEYEDFGEIYWDIPNLLSNFLNVRVYSRDEDFTTINNQLYCKPSLSDTIISIDYGSDLVVDLPYTRNSTGKFYFIKHKNNNRTFLISTVSHGNGVLEPIMDDGTATAYGSLDIQDNSTLVFCDGVHWIVLEPDS